MFIIFIIFQVLEDHGLTDHVWQDKLAAIALITDTLGDKFRPAMPVHAGWLSYIQNNYPWGRFGSTSPWTRPFVS
jgi:hypothetical protein